MIRSNIFKSMKKNMSMTLVKLLDNKKGLTDMSSWQKDEFYQALLAYSPKTGESIDARKSILRYMDDNFEMATTSSMMSSGEKIAKNSCVLEIHVRQPGFRRKLNSEDFLSRNGNVGEVDADVLHVSQDIIERKEVKDLKTQRVNLLKSIKSLAVPGGMLTLGNGQHLIPLSYVDAINTRISSFIENREHLINDFEIRYPDIIKTAKKKRGVFFRQEDYPDFEIIRSKYTTEFRFISNNVPEEIEKYSKELYEQEKEKIKLECAVAAQDIRDAARTAFVGLNEHLIDSLGNDEDTGKPKKFYESGVSKLKEFIEQFNNRDLTDDQELRNLIQKSKDLLSNIDVKAVRTNEEMRDNLSKSFQKIKDEADKLVVIKTRKFDL